MFGSNKKIIILAVIAGFLLVLAVLYFLYFNQFSNHVIKKAPENNQNQVATTTQVYEKLIEQGKVGEVVENSQNSGVSNQGSGSQQTGQQKVYDLPDIITTTAGVILEVKDNYIIINGEGTNFTDGQPRSLKCIFDQATRVFLENRTKIYQSNDGLSHLQTGMKVSVSGGENIRGKTEFLANIVNVIQ